jgi:hypothetical protein
VKVARIACSGVVLLALCQPALAAKKQGGPKPATVEAFNRYIRLTEARLDARLESGSGYLWADTPERRARLRTGELVCEPVTRRGEFPVPSGLIHDWVGAVFIPRVTLEKVLALVQDYDNHKTTYKPEVIASKLLRRNGNDFQVYLRLLKHKVITVVLDTEHDARYFPLGGKRWRSRSYSTRIAEIKNPGGPSERALPPGEDHGFLWRLDSYWTFQEADGGVYVECEAVSLTRNVPEVLAWLIQPIVRSLPKEAVSNTLRSTRAALWKAPPAPHRGRGTAGRRKAGPAPH